MLLTSLLGKAVFPIFWMGSKFTNEPFSILKLKFLVSELLIKSLLESKIPESEVFNESFPLISLGLKDFTPKLLNEAKNLDISPSFKLMFDLKCNKSFLDTNWASKEMELPVKPCIDPFLTYKPPLFNADIDLELASHHFFIGQFIDPQIKIDFGFPEYVLQLVGRLCFRLGFCGNRFIVVGQNANYLFNIQKWAVNLPIHDHFSGAS